VKEKIKAKEKQEGERSNTLKRKKNLVRGILFPVSPLFSYSLDMSTTPSLSGINSLCYPMYSRIDNIHFHCYIS